jgi:hypothetical protein
VIRMAISAALAWSDLEPAGIVVDLVGLAYTGGDALTSWHTLLPDEAVRESVFRAAYLCSGKNAQHVKTLLAEEGAPADRFAVFHDESDALAFVVS